MLKRFLAALAMLPMFWASAACAQQYHVWPDGGSLQAAVNHYSHVYIPAGVHLTPKGALIPPGHSVVGAGIGNTILKADPLTFPIDGSAILGSWGGGASRVVADLTIDSSQVAVQALGYRDLTAVRVRLVNGLCGGLVVAGPNVILADSQVHHNSHPSFVAGRGYLDCTHNPLGGFIYGAGVYVSPGDHAPQIVRTLITDSYGPGIDSWGGKNGYISNSTIRDNLGWAALHLYGGATGWSVNDSYLRQTDASFFPHPECYGSGGEGGAAIRACQDSSGLTVTRAALYGYYALLTAINSPVSYLEGNDYHGLVSVDGATEGLISTSLSPRANPRIVAPPCKRINLKRVCR